MKIDVLAEHIVTSHRERTLGFIWNLMLRFQVELAGLGVAYHLNTSTTQIDSLLETTKLSEEIKTLKQHPAYSSNDTIRRKSGNEMYVNSPQMSNLLQWSQIVCAMHGVEV